MTDAEKIEALRKLFDNIDGNIEELKQGAWWDGFYWTRQKVRDIIDPPKPKWRQMVNEEAEKSLIGTPIGAVLYHLSHVANPSEYDAAFELANIVAVCEAQVGDGWQADPERVHPGFWGVAWLLVPLSHEPPDWTVVGHRSAAWLRSLTDGGAA